MAGLNKVAMVGAFVAAVGTAQAADVGDVPQPAAKFDTGVAAVDVLETSYKQAYQAVFAFTGRVKDGLEKLRDKSLPKEQRQAVCGGFQDETPNQHSKEIAGLGKKFGELSMQYNGAVMGNSASLGGGLAISSLTMQAFKDNGDSMTATGNAQMDLQHIKIECNNLKWGM